MMALMTMKVSGLIGSLLALGWCSFRSFAHPSFYVCNSYILIKESTAKPGMVITSVISVLRMQRQEIQSHPNLHSEFPGNLGWEWDLAQKNPKWNKGSCPEMHIAHDTHVSSLSCLSVSRDFYFCWQELINVVLSVLVRICCQTNI